MCNCVYVYIYSYMEVSLSLFNDCTTYDVLKIMSSLGFSFLALSINQKTGRVILKLIAFVVFYSKLGGESAKLLLARVTGKTIPKYNRNTIPVRMEGRDGEFSASFYRITSPYRG